MSFQACHPLAVSLFLSLTATTLHATLSPAPIFTDHMVVQHGKKLPVWGHAFPGEIVTVTFSSQTATTRTNASGRWSLELPPFPPSTKSRELILKGSSSPDTPLVIRNVLVGEIWFCAGQSNMEFPLRKSMNAQRDAEASGTLPIREFRVTAPLGTTAGTPAKWKPGVPQNIREFSAVGFYFARGIFEKTGIPIGLITTAWGGTPIEHFLDLDALPPALRDTTPFAEAITRRDHAIASFPTEQAAYETALAKWNANRSAAKTSGQKFTDRTPRKPYTPEQHHRWNSMIQPLAPFSIRGVLWYQAEHNWNRPHEYAPLFQSLIAQWRRVWMQDDLPFYFVQLPNFGASGRLWPWLREAQQKALSLPATGMAVTIDIGEAKDQHPRNKRDVGHRLALLALNDIYGDTTPNRGRSPSMASVAPEKTTGNQYGFRVTLTNAAGLTTCNGATPDGFEIAGADRQFVHAISRIDISTTPPSMIIHAPSVARPAALRYAWCDSPHVNLVNEIGLPLAPFRTDDWPRVSRDNSPIPISEK